MLTQPVKAIIVTVHRTPGGGVRAVAHEPPLTVATDSLDELPRAVRSALRAIMPGAGSPDIELRMRLDDASERPTCADVVRVLRRNEAELQEHGVSRLAVFGSVARGEATSESDVDLLVAFSRPVGLFGLANLRDLLQRLLGRPVDLITENGLRPAMRERVRQESVVAFG